MAKTLLQQRFLRHTAQMWLLLCVAMLHGLPAATAQQPSSTVPVIVLEGPIGPASADYTIRALQRAASQDVPLAVIRLDTPGGLDKSMRDIISAILDSPVPVATWVAPGGARAASAGTYITYASHFAAMAPATNIGSSTPVQIGGGGSPLPGADRPGNADGGGDDGTGSEGTGNGGDAETGGGQPSSDMERKIVNDAVAYIRSLANLRGRNADWAEESVRSAANLPASEALEQNVIDLIARDTEELLTQLDGREVSIDGRQYTLDLQDATTTTVEPDWRYEFLSVITNPNVAYILLMIGIYGIILEFYNPGMGLPGVTGAICLLLAGFALQMLPISYAGLALMILGIALMVFEILSPSFGVLGVGGIVAFVLGSVMLMDTELPGYQISMPLIAAFAVASVAFVVVVLGALIRSRRQRPTSGTESMVGETAVAREDFERKGQVMAGGEIWTARCDEPVSKGDELRIDAVKGLNLHVSKRQDQS